MDATPQSMNVQITWGADDNQGALSIPAAGSWSVVTYDPQRLLDPANPNSPVYAYLKPGGAVRVIFKDESDTENIVRVGFIDEITHDIATGAGTLRAMDGVSVMVKSKLPEGLGHDATSGQTLRARARWVLKKAGISYIAVEPTVGTDPVVGMPLDASVSAWEQIITAAYDALHAVWLDREGMLRFKYFGNTALVPFRLGGDYSTSIPIESLETKISMEGVFNHIVGYDDDILNDVPVEAKKQTSIDTYGDIALIRDRHNPDSLYWTTQLLKDRGAATVQFNIGTIRPQAAAQVLQLLNVGMADNVQFFVGPSGGELTNSGKILGGRIEANTDTGWSFGLTVYKPAESWYITPSKVDVKTYATNKGGEISSIGGVSGGQYNSAQQQIWVAPAASDTQRHILMDFPPIDFTGIAEVRKAYLRFYRPYHDHAPGEQQVLEYGWLKVRTISAAWTEGVIWPGPVTSTTNEAVIAYPDATGEWFQADVTALVTKWAPLNADGGGQPQYGFKIMPGHNGAYLPDGRAPEHLMLSAKLSGTPAYLYVRTERV